MLCNTTNVICCEKDNCFEIVIHVISTDAETKKMPYMVAFIIKTMKEAGQR